jgi:hypothetical protein
MPAGSPLWAAMKQHQEETPGELPKLSPKLHAFRAFQRSLCALAALSLDPGAPTITKRNTDHVFFILAA